MEDEIFVEDIIENTYEVIDDIELDNPIEETESIDAYSPDDIVSALLQLLNEKNEQVAADEGESSSEQSEDDLTESAPLLVTMSGAIDYTEQIQLINTKLDNIYEFMEEQSVPNDLYTPLNEYSLDSILLLGVLVVLLLSLGYKFIKDNLLHL